MAKIPPDLRLKDIPCISDSPLSINPLRTNIFLLKRAHGQEIGRALYPSYRAVRFANFGLFCCVNHLSGPLRKHMFTCTSSKRQAFDS